MVRARAWQMFLLLAGTLFGGKMLGGVVDWAPFLPKAGQVAFVLFYCLWLWSIAKAASADLATRTEKGKLVPLSGALIYAGLSMIFINRMLCKSDAFEPIAILACVLSVGSLIFSVFNVAMRLVSVEKGRSAKFGEYFSTVIALWLFPVGVWFVQPRVNRLSSRTALGQHKRGEVGEE